MILLKHKRTGRKYECWSTFPNNRGEITLHIRANGYHSLPKIEVGRTVQQYLKEEYPMLEIVEDRTFH